MKAGKGKGIRTLTLTNGQAVTINLGEWPSVLNLKEFDDKETEVLRVNRHSGGMMLRVYAMRAVDGKKVAESDEILVADSYKDSAVKAIATCGLTRIKESQL